MILTTRLNPTTQIRRPEPEQFRHSIESWAEQGQEAGRDDELELAATYPQDVADLRAILRLIESGTLHEAAEAVAAADTTLYVDDERGQWLALVDWVH